MAASLAGGALVVAIAALATRLLPDHFPTSIPAIGESNLAYPLTYSNALGILSSLGAILAFYFTTSVRQPRAMRALGAAALPIFSATVYLTLSRGPVAAAIVGFVAYTVLGRPRGFLTGAIAAVPPSVIAIASAYQHSLLTSRDPTTPAATSQGHDVAVVILLCVAAAATLRVLLTPVDDRLAGFHLKSERRRPIIAGAWAAAAVAIVALGLALNVPSRISDQYHRFVHSSEHAGDIRLSVFSTANRGLVDNWRVALDGFRDSPLHGQGAGTFDIYWIRHRPANQAGYDVTDAHSLYAETLGELGLVGLALLLIVVVGILVALAPFGRGPHRTLYAALFATALAWAVHAGIDWDWEMPAVTVGVLAVGGAALAAHERSVFPGWPSQSARVTIAVLLLATAVTPGLVFASQRHLNAARDALAANNCPKAVDKAAASINVLSNRPEPYEILAICQQRARRTPLAIQAMRKAVKRDPNNGQYHFELAALLGAASLDAHAELATASRLNPTDAALKQLLKDTVPGFAVNWDAELLPPGGATAGTP
jgi:hypothetical protein